MTVYDNFVCKVYFIIKSRKVCNLLVLSNYQNDVSFNLNMAAFFWLILVLFVNPKAVLFSMIISENDTVFYTVYG